MIPQQERCVVEAVQRGRTLSQSTRGTATTPAICSFNTLKFRRIVKPELDRFMISNARHPLSRSHLMRFQIVPAPAFFSLTEPQPEIPPFEMGPGDCEWVLSLISRKYNYDMRQDICPGRPGGADLANDQQRRRAEPHTGVYLEASRHGRERELRLHSRQPVG